MPPQTPGWTAVPKLPLARARDSIRPVCPSPLCLSTVGSPSETVLAPDNGPHRGIVHGGSQAAHSMTTVGVEPERGAVAPGVRFSPGSPIDQHTRRRCPAARTEAKTARLQPSMKIVTPGSRACVGFDSGRGRGRSRVVVPCPTQSVASLAPAFRRLGSAQSRSTPLLPDMWPIMESR